MRIKLATVPWSYFVLSPISTVTQVATDQVKNSLIIAGVIAVLAILIGHRVAPVPASAGLGRGTSRTRRFSCMAWPLPGAIRRRAALVVDAC